jgi:hypothetical protein
MRLLHRGDACCYKGTVDIVELCLVADLLNISKTDTERARPAHRVGGRDAASLPYTASSLFCSSSHLTAEKQEQSRELAPPRVDIPAATCRAAPTSACSRHEAQRSAQPRRQVESGDSAQLQLQRHGGDIPAFVGTHLGCNHHKGSAAHDRQSHRGCSDPERVAGSLKAP